MLTVQGLGVRFGRRWVLRDVDMGFQPGQVHGLIGHNGSGKSTLIKTLSGYHSPTAGTVSLDGRSIGDADPSVIRRSGLRFVHQDLGLVPEFTGLENMGIGGTYSTRRPGTIDWARQRRRLERVLATFGGDVPLDVPVQQLAAVQRSLLAIARAVETDIEEDNPTRFLVLDEPTTALEGPEVGHLFDVVRSLCESGIGVIYVSHNLRDVLALSATISVLRDGRRVAEFAEGRATHDDLVAAMLGDTALAAEQLSAQTCRPAAPATDGAPRLSVRNLRSKLLRGVDLDVARGEAVCVMGLSGSGREELAYALSGAINSVNDGMTIDGRPLTGLRPHTCRDFKVALVPGNRMPGSSIADFTVRENLSLVSLDRHRGPLRNLRRRSERAATRSWTRRLAIQPDDAEYSTRNLSGGNKQKVILAKWLETDPSLMLIDEPTAGVDIGARQKILAELRGLVDEGRSLLITTSDIEDAVEVADRVIILNGGRVTHDLRRGRDDISEKAVLTAMNAVSEVSPPAPFPFGA